MLPTLVGAVSSDNVMPRSPIICHCYVIYQGWRGPFPCTVPFPHFLGIVPRIHVLTMSQLLILYACPKNAIFLFIIWAEILHLVWSSFNVLLFALFSSQLIRRILRQHRFQLLLIFFHPSAPYVMTGHTSALTNFTLRSLRTPLSFQIVSTVAFSALPVLALMRARWPSGLQCGTGDRVVLGSNPAAATSLRNFGNSVYHATPLCQCLSEETLSGVYARGSKRSHQSALEMCNLSWTPPPTLRDHTSWTTLEISLATFVCYPVPNEIKSASFDQLPVFVLMAPRSVTHPE